MTRVLIGGLYRVVCSNGQVGIPVVKIRLPAGGLHGSPCSTPRRLRQA